MGVEAWTGEAGQARIGIARPDAGWIDQDRKGLARQARNVPGRTGPEQIGATLPGISREPIMGSRLFPIA